MMGKRACMICGKERNGEEVKEDYVIQAMRWFKENVTKNAKGYRIVVCNECMPEYRKLRSKFVRRRVMYVGLGVVFTITLAVVSGGRYLGILFYGVAITLFLYALSLVSYVPDLKRGEQVQASPARKSRR
ncbi:MAG: hypothetical protein KGH94_02680 [Candidatus Micrarchaeota archaeon]|nr:hypothetical protein [Candidatus Micrarchaeota archaeon]